MNVNIMRNFAVSLVLPAFVFGFVVLSSNEMNVKNVKDVNFGISKTYGDGDSGGGGGGGDGGDGSYNYCSNGYSNFPTCGPTTCTNGATNFPACNNQCTPLGTQTQYLTCPAGQSGQITQTRNHTCPANAWSAWSTTSNTCQNNTCTNGATNYPSCNNNVCTNGATNYPSCNNNVCTNGATNYPNCNNNYCTNGATNFPTCNTCSTNYVFTNGQCVYQPPVCSNGATNFPYCNTCPAGQYYINGMCTNTPPTCSNGATNYPLCNNQCTPLGTETQTLQCPWGQTGIITQSRTHTCPANTWGSWITTSNTCQNNTCSNGATNYPYCNNNTCTNGATNFPACNNQCVTQSPETITEQCPWGQTGLITKQRTHSCPGNIWSQYTVISNTCQNIVQTCSNGATNYPYCNNNTCNNGCNNYPNCNQCPSGMVFLNGTCSYPVIQTCNNGATNYPYCNNQYVPPVYIPPTPPQVWCNGVQYYAGYICPTYNLSVQTTGANPLSTTAVINGYVNPYNNNASIWFDYGTNYSNLAYQTTRQNTSINGQFTANLSNLQCGTRYYYRAAAQNNVETKYGQTLSFVTPNCYVAPVKYENLVITRLATKVGAKSAQLNGSFIDNSNNTNSCVSFFDYGTNMNLSKRTVGQKLYANYATNYFSQGVYGLTPNTTYYYRAGVTCLDGTKFGEVYKFTTGAIYTYVAKKKVYTYVEAPKTIVSDKNTCNCEIPEYMSITLDPMEGEATIGKTANYRINFKNISESAVNNVVVRVVLPTELTIAGADKGQFTKGGQTLTYALPMLRALEEGSIIISTNVDKNLELGRQIVVNAYADYTTPTLKKSGNLNKGEVTAYTISVAGNGTAMNPGAANSNVNSVSSSWMPQNFMEWVIFFIVFAIFLTAVRYVFTAFNKA